MSKDLPSQELNGRRISRQQTQVTSSLFSSGLVFSTGQQPFVTPPALRSSRSQPGCPLRSWLEPPLAFPGLVSLPERSSIPRASLSTSAPFQHRVSVVPSLLGGSLCWEQPTFQKCQRCSILQPNAAERTYTASAPATRPPPRRGAANSSCAKADENRNEGGGWLLSHQRATQIRCSVSHHKGRSQGSVNPPGNK